MHRPLMLLLCFVLAAPAPGPARGATTDAAALAAYEKAWAGREQLTKDGPVNARIGLAEDLLKAAAASRGADGELLCERAYLWGRRAGHVLGSVAAAKALELLQRKAPQRRIECLELMIPLYKAHFKNPAKQLGTGIAYAELMLELAEQRRLGVTFASAISADQLGGVKAGLARAKRDYGMARQLLSQTLARANTLARHPSIRRNEDAAGQLTTFVARHEPTLKTIEGGTEELRTLERRWRALFTAVDAHKAAPGPATAKLVAEAWLIEFDNPAAAIEQAGGGMAPEERRMADLARARVSDLSMTQLERLGDWYAGLADRASDGARVEMLTRAHVYLNAELNRLDVEDKNVERVSSKLLKANTQLRDLGIDRRRLSRLAHTRAEQLNTTGKALAARQAAPPPVKPAAIVAAAPRPETPEPRPETSAPRLAFVKRTLQPSRPDAVDAAPAAIMAPDSHTLTCQRCFSRYLPRYAGTAELCPRCASGRKSIFDFGEK